MDVSQAPPYRPCGPEGTAPDAEGPGPRRAPKPGTPMPKGPAARGGITVRATGRCVPAPAVRTGAHAGRAGRGTSGRCPAYPPQGGVASGAAGGMTGRASGRPAGPQRPRHPTASIIRGIVRDPRSAAQRAGHGGRGVSSRSPRSPSCRPEKISWHRRAGLPSRTASRARITARHPPSFRRRTAPKPVPGRHSRAWPRA